MISYQNKKYTTLQFYNGVKTKIRRELEFITNLPCRYIYRNFAGFWNSLIPKTKTMLYLARKKNQASRIGNLRNLNKAKKLHQNGYLLELNAYDPVLVTKLVTKCNEILDDPQSYLKVPSGASRYIFQPLKAIPDLKKLLSIEIVDTIHNYYGGGFYIASVRVCRNYHVP